MGLGSEKLYRTGNTRGDRAPSGPTGRAQDCVLKTVTWGMKGTSVRVGQALRRAV
jgi:hypothetical protein